MPTNAYGTTNPRALEPFSIESTLAPMAVTPGPAQAEAQSMLSHYQLMREAAEGQYGIDMGQQHDYAYKELAARIQDQHAKTVIEGAKTAGALDLIAASPELSDIVGGIDPRVLQSVAGGVTGLQRAETFQKGAQGVQESTTAGFQPSSDQAAIATGGLAGKQGVPLQMQIESMKEAAANARANATNAQAREPNQTIQIQTPQGLRTLSYPGKYWSEDKIDADLKAKNVPMYNTGPARPLPPEAQALAPGGGGATSLQPAPQQPPAQPTGAQTPQTPAPNNSDARMPALQKAAKQYYDSLPPSKVKDNILAGMQKNNGKAQIGFDARGGAHIIGGDGTPY